MGSGTLLYNLPYAICTCTVGCTQSMYLFLPACSPILALITCTQRNTSPYVVVSRVELISDTFTLPVKHNRCCVSLVGIYGISRFCTSEVPLYSSRKEGTVKTVYVDLRRVYQVLEIVRALSIHNQWFHSALISRT